MPELPEVETIRRQLAPEVEGKGIVDVEVFDERWTRPRAAAGAGGGGGGPSDSTRSTAAGST